MSECLRDQASGVQWFLGYYGEWRYLQQYMLVVGSKYACAGAVSASSGNTVHFVKYATNIYSTSCSGALVCISSGPCTTFKATGGVCVSPNSTAVEKFVRLLLTGSICLLGSEARLCLTKTCV